MVWPFARALSRFRQARKTTELPHPSHRNIPYSGRTVARVYVTPDRALMNDTVWAAHRYLTQTVAQLPARVQRDTSSGTEQVAAHPVDSLLNWRVNPELSPYQFKETMVGWALMHGNGVAEIERDAVGRAINLWPIEPHRIRFLRDVETHQLIYRVNNGTDGTVDLGSNDVFHLRGFGNGAVGLSVIEYAAQSIGWARATELFGAAFFGNGMNAGGAIEGTQGMDDAAVERLLSRIDERHGGPANSHRPLILDGGLTWKTTSVTPDDAQFVATMQHQVETICRWMGAPPHKVYHLLRMTFNNVEQLSIDVVGDCIVPWAMRLEQEATYKLFGQNRAGFHVTFEVKGLLRGDFLSRQTGLQILRRNGVINADDWAGLEDMKKPGKAAGGSTYIVEGNMTTMDQVGQKPLAAPAALPTPANDPGAAAAVSRARARLGMEVAHV
jgi:HK97 family phage portal protein